MSNPIIPQRLLQHYRELVQSEKRVQESRQRLRAHILDLLRRGVPIERGQLHYRLQRVARTQLTKNAVLASLGWDAYQALIADITPVFSDRLVIVDADSDVVLE